jgi:hypothetical protein
MNKIMRDSEYDKLLWRLSKAHAKYSRLLREAEDELENRYNIVPGDIDFDSWIDKYHVVGGFMSAEQIDNELVSAFGLKSARRTRGNT